MLKNVNRNWSLGAPGRGGYAQIFLENDLKWPPGASPGVEDPGEGFEPTPRVVFHPKNANLRFVGKFPRFVAKIPR